MKRLWLLLLAVTLAAPALGQTVGTDGQKFNSAGSTGAVKALVTGGITRADTTIRATSVDVNGNTLTSEASKDRENVRLVQNAISNSALAVNTADSTAVPIDIHDLRHVKLLIKLTPSTGTGTTSRIAIQLRECMNGNVDSTSMFAEYQVAGSTRGSGAGGAVDTLSFGHMVTGSNSLAWSGEFTVSGQTARNAYGNALAVGTNTFYYPNGISIMLDRVFGSDAWWNRLSIRVRNIAGPTCAVTIHVLGISQ